MKVTKLDIIFAVVIAWFGAVVINQVMYGEPHPSEVVVEEALPALDAAATAAILRRGNEILTMAIKAFHDKPSQTMAKTLYQMTEEYGKIVEPECGNPQAIDSEELLDECTLAVTVIINSYNVLLTYVSPDKKL